MKRLNPRIQVPMSPVLQSQFREAAAARGLRSCELIRFLMIEFLERNGTRAAEASLCASGRERNSKKEVGHA
jgi:hypothetical protein